MTAPSLLLIMLCTLAIHVKSGFATDDSLPFVADNNTADATNMPQGSDSTPESVKEQSLVAMPKKNKKQLSPKIADELKAPNFNGAIEETYARNDNRLTITIRENHYGQMTEKSYIDANGESAINSEGVGIIAYHYDRNGNLLNETYQDIDGQFTSSNTDIASIHYEYDKNNNLTKQSYLDMSDSPVAYEGLVASVELQYDELNNVIRELYRDISGVPVLNDYLIAGVVYKYHPLTNMLIEKSYFDTAGLRTIGINETAGVQYNYDVNNRLTDFSCFDMEGNPLRWDNVDDYGLMSKMTGKDPLAGIIEAKSM
ncbi:MAG: hypothetical protein HRT35_00400 [Algicola sp.]|nr:hypothetical protein [Algicola sp.]